MIRRLFKAGRQFLAPPRPPDPAEYSEDLLQSRYGTRRVYGWWGYRRAPLMDRIFDARLSLSFANLRLAWQAARRPPLAIHIASVDVPKYRPALTVLLAELRRSRHRVTISLAPMGDRGKFENINLALQNVDLSQVDWLLVVDDDIAVPARFLDRFIGACEQGGLRIAQPAHRFRSHTSWAVTQRRWHSLLHTTAYVESGPVTAFHRDVLPHVLPFPQTRWSWGVDVAWGEMARLRGFTMGVVDATPIAHLRPVAQTYDGNVAASEGRALLARLGIARSNRDILRTFKVIRKF